MRDPSRSHLRLAEDTSGARPARADSELVTRAREGDTTAFNRLATRHRERILNYALRSLGDREAAEDVTQDVLIRLHRALPGFRGDAEIATWLYRVTVNLCRDHLRRMRRRGREAPLGGADDRPELVVLEDPVADVARERAMEAVERALQRLPERQREAVLLRYLGELSYAEIAAVTDTPQGTVASRVFRALRRLGQELDTGQGDTGS